jgi:hypothetical protein
LRIFMVVARMSTEPSYFKTLRKTIMKQAI